MNNITFFSKLFETLKRKTTLLEMGLYGGSYHRLSLIGGALEHSESREDLSINIRGIYRRNYFSFNTKPGSPEHIRQKLYYQRTIKAKTAPLLTRQEQYRNVTATSPFLKKLDPLLIYHHLQTALAPFLNDHEISFVVKSGSIHPGFTPVQSFSILNSKGISAHYENRRGFVTIKNSAQKYEWIINSEDQLTDITQHLKQLKHYQTLKPGKLSPRKERIILSRQAVAKLIWALKDHFSVTASKDPNWFFKGNFRTRLFSRLFHLEDSPFHPLIQGRPFDDAGAPKDRVVLIDDGYFKELTVSLQESKRYRATPTGHTRLYNPASTLTYPAMKGDNIPILDQIKGEPRVILIQDLTPNIKTLQKESSFPVIGDGILYQHGEPTEKLSNLMIQISLKELLMRIISRGEVKLSLGAAVPELLIDKVPVLQT